MPSFRRALVPRSVSRALNPVNMPSPRSIVQSSMPGVRKPRRRRTARKTTR